MGKTQYMYSSVLFSVSGIPRGLRTHPPMEKGETAVLTSNNFNTPSVKNIAKTKQKKSQQNQQGLLH